VSGFYALFVRVSDGVDTVCRSQNLAIYGIAISSAGPAPGVLPNATQNAAYDTTVTATGGTGPYQYTASFMPNGLSLDQNGATAGRIHGTVNTGPGKYSINVTATDSNGLSRIQTLALSVIATPATLPSIS